MESLFFIDQRLPCIRHDLIVEPCFLSEQCSYVYHTILTTVVVLKNAPIHVETEDLGVKLEKWGRNKTRNTRKRRYSKMRGNKEKKGVVGIYVELKQQNG